MILVVQEYGAKVSKKSNCLCIKSASGEKEISTNQITELHLYQSCNISADVIQLCMKKEIWILFFDGFGNPNGEIVPFSGGCAPVYKRNQLLLAHSREGVELVKGFLTKKIKNRVRQMKKILLNRRKEETLYYLSVRIKRMENALQSLDEIQGSDMEQLRDVMQGIEGSAGRAYFECITYLLPEKMKFAQRMRNADDVYNCSLNYLYGILYAKIKHMMIQCRLDPYIGIMHADTYNEPTFVFDFIEGYRIICEELAYEICCHLMITREDMEKREDGRSYFSEKARKLLVSKFYEKLGETVFYKKNKVSQERKIYLELMEVAKQIGEMDYKGLVAIS